MGDIGNTGRDLLNLSISGDSTNKRFGKRQISAGTYALNGGAPAVSADTYENKLQRVSYIGARKPGVVPNMWSAEEDEMLAKAVKKHGDNNNWREVAEEVPGRNHLQCLQRWKKALRPGLVKGHWRREEDDLLLSLIKPYVESGTLKKINWSKIAAKIEGRNAKQCRERWFLNLDPSINRGPWSAEEDRRLLELARQCGGRWSLISKNMEGRTENAVKTRFHSLQRQEARSRGWTQEEDERLIETVLMMGREWGKVSKQLPGRSRGQLKKRFGVLAQSRPDLNQKVEMLEADIKSGRYKAPNPPPAPINVIPSTFMKPQPTQTFQPSYFSRPSGGAAAAPSMPAPGSWAQPQTNFAPPPTFDSVAQPSQQTQNKPKGFRKYGSSWMAGFDFDNAPQASGNTAEPALRRQDSSKFLPKSLPSVMGMPSDGKEAPAPGTDNNQLSLLDRLLTEGADGDFLNAASLGGEALPPKGLRTGGYNSWGSVGGGDNALFGAPSNGTEAPNIMRTGLNRPTLQKMNSSNWGGSMKGLDLLGATPSTFKF